MRISYIISFVLSVSLIAILLYWNQQKQALPSQTVVERDENTRKLWNHGGWIGDADQQFESIRIVLSRSIDEWLSSMENLTRDLISDQQEPLSFDPYKKYKRYLILFV